MRATDIVKHTRFMIPKFYGVVVVLDGRDIGSGSIVWGIKDRPYLCLEISDELRQKPVFMNRVAKHMIRAAMEVLGELYTIESSKEPTAPKWLARLGFVPTGETVEGERVLKWQKSSEQSASSAPRLSD